MVYLNNFPREGAVKGQKFKGDKTLEDELVKRKIIGDGDVTAETACEQEAGETIIALEGENSDLTAKLKEAGETIIALTAFVEEAITMPKGQVPNGYEKD